MLELFAKLYNFLAGVFPLIIVLGVIVLVHELGHFIAARLMKVKVETFSFGFGKRLLGKKFGDTDVRLSLIPLGGYVKMAGEEDFEAKDPKPYEFQAKNRAQKIFILIAGPAMNMILAFLVLLGIYLGGVEVETYKSAPPRLGYVDKDSAAHKAGLQKGDLILEIAGDKIPNWKELELTIASNPNDDLDVEYERQGKIEKTKLRVAVMTRQNLNPAGIFWGYKTRIHVVDKGRPAAKGGMKKGDIILKINDKEVSLFELKDTITSSAGQPLQFLLKRGKETVSLEITPAEIDGEWKIGIEMRPYAATVKKKYGFFAAIGRSGEEVVRLTSLTFMAIKKLVTGKIAATHVSGPIEIARVSRDAMDSGASNFLLLIAFLSLHIGLLNLLPIPVLDGGHLLIYSIESIIRRDFNPKVKIALMNVGFFLLVALMAFAILNDIAKTLPNGWSSFWPF